MFHAPAGFINLVERVYFSADVILMTLVSLVRVNDANQMDRMPQNARVADIFSLTRNLSTCTHSMVIVFATTQLTLQQLCTSWNDANTYLEIKEISLSKLKRAHKDPIPSIRSKEPSTL
jgi:hypothetical protein